MNSKSARKKLVKALFNVPRQALDLLPMYARLVAILDKVYYLREDKDIVYSIILCCVVVDGLVGLNT